MKLEQLKVLDVQRIGNLDSGIEAGISEESLPFVFEVISRQLYSNPIGSVIREITSNCFDSHIEAGIDDPVIIRKGYDLEEGHYIEFQDFGVGISPDRMENIYVNYFSSTKRADNTQIGGFGIGSKTPLAYADLFYITTRYNLIEYSYIFHKGESKPTLELLGTKDTTERNGTIIRIIMESGDTSIFQSELKNQLTYFDNIYFDNWSINNDYDIYEGKYFKFRSDILQGKLRQHFSTIYDTSPVYATEIHISIGNVKYPIDFKKVNIKRTYIGIPVAVKFDIGELQITPSRENIRYNDEGIKLIQERVDLAIVEILDLFEKQNPEAQTLEEYNNLVTKNVRLVFDKQKDHALEIWDKSDLDKKYKFAPLSELPIKKNPVELFFMWEQIGYINATTEMYYPSKFGNTSVNNLRILNDKFIIVKKGEKLSKYTDINISRKFGYGDIYLIRKKELNFDNISKELGLKTATSELGKSKTILGYIRVIDKIVKEKGTLYSDYKPTEEWIAAYNKEIRESTAAFIRKKNKKVFVRDVTNGDRGRELTIGELSNRTGILVYGFREDKNLLSGIALTVRKNVESVRKAASKYKGGEAFLVLQISKSIEKDIIDAEKTIYCKDFLKTKFIRKVVSARILKSNMLNLDLKKEDLREELLQGLTKDKKEIDNFIKKYYKGDYYLDAYNVEPIDEIVNMYKKLEKYTMDIPLLNSISYLDKDDIKEYTDYLKYKKIPLKYKYYLKSKEQLKYEQGIRDILNTIKFPIKHNLLNYKLNQNENVNNNEESSSQETGDSSF